MNVKTHGGFYESPYQQFFVESLFKDLDGETIKKLNRCGLGFIGDSTDREFIKNEAARTNVWIAITAEDEHDSAGLTSQALSSVLGPQGRALIIRSFWNDESKADIVHDGHITSMYIPWASVSFGERGHHTPMDLYNRSGINFDRERKGTLAYMVSSWCWAKQSGVSMRDKVFDVLDRELRAADRMPGSALGGCTGTNKSRENGYTNFNGVHCDADCTRYDRTVARYEDFQFVLAMEHGLEFPDGFVTEKMVDALLAGAVPISDSMAVRAEVFDRNSYIAVDSTEVGMRAGAQTMVELLGDPQRWDRIRRQPSISEKSLRKYFSWHPAVWKSHGDLQRRQILGEILKLCGWM